jgi:alcohol dehydrogenase class IV
MTDMVCLEGLERAARSLVRAYENGSDRAAREDMCWASLLGGMALANAGLGVVHGFAAPIGGMFPAPHGAVCAAVLPHGMETNLKALRARAPESASLHRYEKVARVLTGNPRATPEDGLEWVRTTCRKLNVPRLSSYGVTPADIPILAAKALNASSMKGNPLPLTAEELVRIVSAAL